jgi:hypothetical protein
MRRFSHWAVGCGGYSRRVLRTVSIAASLALVCVLVAGCGARSNKPFTAAGSAACFAKAKGFKKVTTEQSKVGFIAGFAANGGLRATATDGNVLTVAFAVDEAGATSTERAFRRFAPAKLRPRMSDIMESDRNAVLVWTVSPTPEQLATAMSCLHR